MRWFNSGVRTVLFVGLLFALAYGGSALAPRYAALDGSLPIDSAIPFIPMFILLYGVAYIAPLALLMVPEHFLSKALSGFAIVLLVGAACFLLIPIRFEKHVVYGDDVFSELAKVQHGVDTDYNNFPSLHVAVAIYVWLIVLYVNRRIGAYLSPIAIGIVISVVFVKQHLVIDVLGGIILGTGVFIWCINSKRMPFEEKIRALVID